MTQSIVQIGNPILRERAVSLTPEEILSEKIQTLIDDLCETMRAAPGVGLAAPQIGVPLQIVVVEDRPEYTENVPKKQLELKERKPFPLHILINPTIVTSDSDTAEFFEGCLSIEGFIGVVPRRLAIVVNALNEKAEPIIIRARGWYARILQHEIDHLNGILCIDRTKISTLTTIENYLEFWVDKPIIGSSK